MATPPTTPPILTLSHNIAIRPFLSSDAASLAHHANDKEMWLNGPDIVPFPFTLVDGIAYIARANDTTSWAQPSAGPDVPTMYAIVLTPSSSTEDDSKDDAKCIGSIEFVPGTDIHSRTFKLGYWLGREYWGKGTMSEVVTAFVDWIWRTFERSVRIEAEVHDFNRGSGRVLEKVGFVREGTLRCAVWKEGRLAGLEVWGLVREGVVV
ncbi:acyl-CoA N-acyltransferase [Hyaloscypha variabilis]